MNIIEEQNKIGGTNPDVTCNTQMPTTKPSAKKVYSKPTLVVLHTPTSTQGKIPDTGEPSITSLQPLPRGAS